MTFTDCIKYNGVYRYTKVSRSVSDNTTWILCTKGAEGMSSEVHSATASLVAA